MRLFILLILTLTSCKSKKEVVNVYCVQLGDSLRKREYKFQLGNFNDTMFLKNVVIESFTNDSFYFVRSENYDSIIVFKYIYHGSDILVYKHSRFGPVYCVKRGVAVFNCKLVSSNYLDSNQVLNLLKFCKEIDSNKYIVPAAN